MPPNALAQTGDLCGAAVRQAPYHAVRCQLRAVGRGMGWAVSGTCSSAGRVTCQVTLQLFLTLRSYTRADLMKQQLEAESNLCISYSHRTMPSEESMLRSRYENHYWQEIGSCEATCRGTTGEGLTKS